MTNLEKFCGGSLLLLAALTWLGGRHTGYDPNAPAPSPGTTSAALPPAAATVSAPTAPKPEEPKDLDLEAYVFTGGSSVAIQNPTKVAWTACTMEINGHGFTSGYTLDMGTVGPEDVRRFDLMEFANDDGVRFNPMQMKPMNLYLACQTPKGRGTYFGTFGHARADNTQ